MRTVTYKDKSGEWRWKRLAGNNREVAESGESYQSKEYTLQMAAESFPDDAHYLEEPMTGELVRID